MNTLDNHFKEQLKRSGKKITINNNICCYAFFKEIKDKEYIDTKNIYIDVNANVMQGDIIDCLNQKWIVVQQQENYNNVYSIYTIRRLDNVLKFKFADGVYSIDVIVEDSIQSVTGVDVSLIEGKIQIIAQSNNITKHLIEGIRFILYGRAWEIESNTQTEKNIVKFYCKKGLIQENLDDLENEIAYNEKLNKISVSDKYEITTDTDTIDLKQNKTVPINIEFKKNNIIDTDPKVEYIFDKNYISFDKATKTLTGLQVGQTDFKIVYNNVEKIIKVNVVVEEVIKGLEISGQDTHKIGKMQQYTIENPQNKTIKCTLSPAEFGKVRETTNTSVMILVNRVQDNVGKTMKIRVEDADDSSVYVEKEVTLKPMF